jgi:hypothetical protein
MSLQQVEPHETERSETRLFREIERIPDSPLRREMVALLGELVAFCAAPRCTECQGDGVPCGSLLRPCDGCPDCVGRVTELRNLLRSGA